MSKILIVDDSPDLLEFLVMLLKLKKYEVESANSKKEMFEKLSSFSPDIILLDVKLSGEDGRELCRSVKANALFSGIFIILLSADPMLLERYNEYAADAAIEKPFNIKNVIETISNLLQ